MTKKEFDNLKIEDFENGAVNYSIRKVFTALEIIQKCNPLKNNLDTYLYDIAEWGFGIKKAKPKKEDYGI